jgi:hypothetical protein
MGRTVCMAACCYVVRIRRAVLIVVWIGVLGGEVFCCDLLRI